MASKPILVEKQGHVCVFTLNRPQDMNAVNRDLSEAFEKALDAFEADDSVWVGVVKSSNPKVFCAGADLKSINKGESVQTAKGGFAGIVSYPRQKPMIACVDGPALAGGCEICLACDIIVASKSSRFGLPEVKRSLVAAAGGTYRLPKKIARGVAMDVMLTGEPISAERAYQLGLVSRLAEPGQSFEAAMKLANSICENAPLAVRATRGLVAASDDQTEAQAQKAAGEALVGLMATEDFKEGPRAFIEKRAPKWTGKKAKL